MSHRTMTIPIIPAARTTPCALAPEACGLAGDARADHMLSRIGQLTRVLHDSLRELGYDRELERAASSIPDVRDRLNYVATMTEQAAQRVLAATEIAMPVQEALGASATALAAQWDRVLRRDLSLPEFKALVTSTQAYLREVPAHAQATNAQLLNIMMAQDFQDLTGQVIKKITDIVQMLESHLVTLLVENLPPERRSEEANSLLNGPVIDGAGSTEVVSSQAQVDDLLESLGF